MTHEITGMYASSHRLCSTSGYAAVIHHPSTLTTPMSRCASINPFVAQQRERIETVAVATVAPRGARRVALGADYRKGNGWAFLWRCRRRQAYARLTVRDRVWRWTRRGLTVDGFASSVLGRITQRSDAADRSPLTEEGVAGFSSSRVAPAETCGRIIITPLEGARVQFGLSAIYDLRASLESPSPWRRLARDCLFPSHRLPPARTVPVVSARRPRRLSQVRWRVECVDDCYTSLKVVV